MQPKRSVSIWPIVAWVVASGIGITLTEQKASPAMAALAPVVTVVLALVLCLPASRLRRQRCVRPESLND